MGWAVAEKMVEDAIASEMDHTQPYMLYVLLSAVQIPFCYAVSQYYGEPVPLLAFIAMAAHWFAFVPSYAFSTDNFFDFTGEVTFTAVFLVSYAGSAGTLRQQIMLGINLVWCIRLGYFLFTRIRIRGSDWRFKYMKDTPAYFFFGWTCQGTWILLNGLCVFVLNSPENSVSAAKPLGALDFVGYAIWALGFCVEVLADRQKYAFNEAHASGRNPDFIRHGLWAWSRHPNYFGENLIWVGTAIACAAGLDLGTWSSPSKWAIACVVTAVWSWFFLFYSSLMLLEKRCNAKWGKDPLYRQYKRVTPVLAMWPPSETIPYSKTSKKRSPAKKRTRSKSPARR